MGIERPYCGVRGRFQKALLMKRSTSRDAGSPAQGSCPDLLSIWSSSTR